MQPAVKKAKPIQPSRKTKAKFVVDGAALAARGIDPQNPRYARVTRGKQFETMEEGQKFTDEQNKLLRKKNKYHNMIEKQVQFDLSPQQLTNINRMIHSLENRLYHINDYKRAYVETGNVQPYPPRLPGTTWMYMA